jgi:hypothetical protein
MGLPAFEPAVQVDAPWWLLYRSVLPMKKTSDIHCVKSATSVLAHLTLRG